MELMTLEGYENKHSLQGTILPVLLGYKKNLPAVQYYNTNLGFFSSVFRAVKSVVKKVGSVAKSAVSAVGSVVKTVASPVVSLAKKIGSPISAVAGAVLGQLNKIPVLGEVTSMADKIIDNVNPLGKLENIVNNLDDPLKLGQNLKIVADLLPPGVGSVVRSAVDVVNNPSALMNPSKLVDIAVNSVKIPGVPVSLGQAVKLGKKIKEIAEDPRKLLNVNTVLDIADVVGVKTPSVLKKANEIVKKINDVKKFVKNAGDYSKIEDLQKELKDIANKEIVDNSKQIIKKITEYEKNISPYFKKAVNHNLKMDRLNRLSMILKGNTIPDEDFTKKYLELSESEAIAGIISDPRFSGLSKLDKVSQVYKAILKRPPTTIELKKYLAMTNPENVIFKDLYQSEEFKKKQAQKNIEITKRSRVEAEKVYKEKEKQRIKDQTRYFVFAGQNNPFQNNQVASFNSGSSAPIKKIDFTKLQNTISRI